MNTSTNTKIVDGINFVWIRPYKENTGYWRSCGRPTIVRVYPPASKDKSWCVISGTPETNNGVYEGRANKVWEKAAKWVKNPLPPLRKQPKAEKADAEKEDKPKKKRKGIPFTLVNTKRKERDLSPRY